MQHFYLILACIYLFNANSFSQNRNIVATKVQNNTIVIDGNLNESAWTQAQEVDSFTTWDPNFGKPASRNSHVKMMYDDNAFYISAYLEESSRDSIMTQYANRDDIGNTDWFGVVLDTYGSGTDGYEFIVSSTEVQFDARLTTDGEDESWDAVWDGKVNLTNEGWYVEMKIPYSAFRFANQEEQFWHINFMRKIARINEKAAWNTFDPQGKAFLIQTGVALGIKDIKTPVRLSLSPYLSGYFLHSSDRINEATTGYSYNGGMDLKYGINDAFTLDMTLVPDFGQVRTDDVVLNLSPFEIQYNENRQFFTEGTELFSKGDLFYSRRIGGQPIGKWKASQQVDKDEHITSNPESAKLLNATKISGRTKKGLGVGFFNAFAGKVEASVENFETGEKRHILTAPSTNYNVIVLDQNLPNNSSATLVNTYVLRAGSEYYNANVSSGMVSLKNKKQTIGINSILAVSQKYYQTEKDEFGTKYGLSISKIQGEFQYGASYGHIGKNFDPNDLGFQSYSNENTLDLFANYSKFKAFGPFNRGNFWLGYTYNRLDNPNRYANMNLNYGFWVQGKNFWQYNLWSNLAPKGNDFYDPRVDGRFYQTPARANVGFYISSDRRKKVSVEGSINYGKNKEEGRYRYDFSLFPNWRLSDKMSFGLGSEYSNSLNNQGYVGIVQNDIIYGRRDILSWENSIYGSFIINSLMGMDCRIRHYWSKVDYDKYTTLALNGTLDDSDYQLNRDFTFNYFTLDYNYKFRFAPGSDLIFNWKKIISGETDTEIGQENKIIYTNGMKELKTLPVNNSLSLRIIYYIDYNNIKNAL